MTQHDMRLIQEAAAYAQRHGREFLAAHGKTIEQLGPLVASVWPQVEAPARMVGGGKQATVSGDGAPEVF